MTDPTSEAFDRLDRLHRSYPMPQTCRICERHGTTSRDQVCGVCRQDRGGDWW